MRRCDGAAIPVAYTAAPLPDERGRDIGVVVAFEDYTRRKATEDALRESEKWYRTIVETAGEGIGIRDDDGRITFVNARLAAMLGYTVEELVGRSLFDLLDEAGRARALGHME